jgi:capsular exopolysaccharide synthesis family protein
MKPPLVDDRLVSVSAPGSFEAEQYRLLRHIVEQKRKESGAQVLAVTSPAVGDGKTTTAINLAGALAQARDARILLVDLDLRRGALGHQLRLGTDRPGLADLIVDPDATLADASQPWAAAGFDALAAGRVPAAPWDLLKSPRLGQLLDEARRHWDYVILDTPPIVPVPDCRVIEKWVDAFLLVVAAHKTPRRLVEEALEALDPTRLAGLVFNRDDRLSSRAYGGYYGGYAPAVNGHAAWWRRRRRA